MSKKQNRPNFEKKLRFECHPELSVILDNEHTGCILQKCPVCRKEYVIDYDHGTIELLTIHDSADHNKILLHKIYTNLDHGNDIEIRTRSDGRTGIFEISKKLYIV